MAIEDYTEYTEVDENDDITVTSNNLTVSTMRRDALSYVRADKGADHFGDFEHLLEFKYTYADTSAHISIWALSNLYNTIYDRNTNNEGMSLNFYSSAGQERLQLRDEGNENFDHWQGPTINTWYWLTIKRDGTTLTCKIYDDADRTEPPVDTLTVTCVDTAFRYIFGLSSYDTDNYPAHEASGEVQDLDLQEGIEHTHSASDTLAISDSIGVVMAFGHSVADTLSTSDTLTAVAAYKHSASDTLAIGDSMAPAMTFNVVAADTLNLSDSLAALKVLHHSASDTLEISDNLVAVLIEGVIVIRRKRGVPYGLKPARVPKVGRIGV